MGALTLERLETLLSYDPDTGIFRWKVRKAGRVNIGDIAGCPRERGYLVIGIDGRTHRAHRLAWLYVHGSFPAFPIDHRNGVTNDNRIDNLRRGNPRLNSENTKPHQRWAGENLAPGVERRVRPGKPDRFRARVMSEGRLITLGTYDTEIDAAEAYMEGKAEWHLGFLRAAEYPESDA